MMRFLRNHARGPVGSRVMNIRRFDGRTIRVDKASERGSGGGGGGGGGYGGRGGYNAPRGGGGYGGGGYGKNFVLESSGRD